MADEKPKTIEEATDIELAIELDNQHNLLAKANAMIPLIREELKKRQAVKKE